MSEDKPTNGLRKNVAKAAEVRKMCQTKGYEILTAEISKEKARISNKVLDVATTEEQALQFRKEAQIWVALEKMLKAIMLTGEISARNLNNLEASSITEE